MKNNWANDGVDPLRKHVEEIAKRKRKKTYGPPVEALEVLHGWREWQEANARRKPKRQGVAIFNRGSLSDG